MHSSCFRTIRCGNSDIFGHKYSQGINSAIVLGALVKDKNIRCVPPCAAKYRAERPAFARVARELWAADLSKSPRAHEAKR